MQQLGPNKNICGLVKKKWLGLTFKNYLEFLNSLLKRTNSINYSLETLIFKVISGSDLLRPVILVWNATDWLKLEIQNSSILK